MRWPASMDVPSAKLGGTIVISSTCGCAVLSGTSNVGSVQRLDTQYLIEYRQLGYASWCRGGWVYSVCG